MSHGELRCCGSSMYLKGRFSEGYDLTVETSAECDRAKLQAMISGFVPECFVSSNVAKEMRAQLPMSAVQSFPGLFGDADEGVIDYGISTQSIETVFLNQTSAFGLVTAVKPVDEERREDDAVDCSPDELTAGEGGKKRCCTHVRALYIKRLHYGRRDMKSLITSLLIPIAILILGLEVMQNSLRQSTEPPFVLDYQNNFDWTAGPQVPVYARGDSSVTDAVRRV